MEKINIAEILKDCPKGMKLYSPIFGEVYLDEIRPHLAIVVTTDKEQGDFKEEFLYDGRYGMNGECMLFPSKGKTTWEGFVPPCKFNDGDVISNSLGTCIFKGEGELKGTVDFYCGTVDFVTLCVKDKKAKPLAHYGDIFDYRLATEEEKQKLFDAINAYGYKWNKETKILEVEPKFKDGDVIYVKTRGYEWVSIFKEETENNIVSHTHYNLTHNKCYTLVNGAMVLCQNHVILEKRIATEEEKRKLFQAIKDNGYRWNAETKTLEKLLVPKFKIGDRIRHKNDENIINTIYCVYYDSYGLCDGHLLYFKEEDQYELCPYKFDINTLKAFDKVLTRDNDSQKWGAEFFSFYDNDSEDYHFQLVGAVCARYCIPYKGNEHLLGKTDDCDEYYKTWE